MNSRKLEQLSFYAIKTRDGEDIMYETMIRLKDGCSCGFEVIDTLEETIELLPARSAGKDVQEISIKYVDTPSMCWDPWGRRIENELVK